MCREGLPANCWDAQLRSVWAPGAHPGPWSTEPHVEIDPQKMSAKLKLIAEAGLWSPLEL